MEANVPGYVQWKPEGGNFYDYEANSYGPNTSKYVPEMIFGRDEVRPTVIEAEAVNGGEESAQAKVAAEIKGEAEHITG